MDAHIIFFLCLIFYVFKGLLKQYLLKFNKAVSKKAVAIFEDCHRPKYL